MGIDLSENGNGYNDLMEHQGHHLVVVAYGNEEKPNVNVAIECETCDCVLVDFDRPANDYTIEECIENLNSSIETWGEGETNKKMIAAYSNDKKHMRKAIADFRSGNYAAAWKKICGWDSILRDMVPMKLYDFLQEKFDKE